MGLNDAPGVGGVISKEGVKQFDHLKLSILSTGDGPDGDAVQATLPCGRSWLLVREAYPEVYAWLLQREATLDQVAVRHKELRAGPPYILYRKRRTEIVEWAMLE